jgi:hypothetical protein
MNEPAILRRIRESLATELSESAAAQLLLEALARNGTRVPSDVTEVSEFVHGPLAALLSRRVPPELALRTLRELDELLASAAEPTQEHTVVDPIDDEGPSTDTVAVVSSAVPVLVASRTRALGERLLAALGADRIEVTTRTHALSIRDALEARPLVVVVDASDPPDITPEDLARLLDEAPFSTRATWATELTYGRRFVDACERAGKSCTGARVSDGLGPIADLVASRRQMRAREIA